MDTIFTGLDIWNRVPAAFEYENFFFWAGEIVFKMGLIDLQIIVG